MNIKTIKIKPYMLLPLLPLLAIGVFCLRYQQDFFHYYLPNSQWNDEVIYYKTIEGIVEYGIPQGYFGYNESHASIGTFGAWSPVIYLIDAVWGRIFGWNYYSPIIARIFFSILAMLIYAVTCRPDIRKSIYISLYMIGFSLFARYLASQMADCYIVELLIIFAALYDCKNKSSRSAVAVKVLIVALTLVRPYFVLLWLPFYSSRNEKKYLVFELLIALFSIIAYFIISKYLTAAYFTSLIKLGWLKMILNSPVEGMRNLIYTIYKAINLINEYIASALTSGNSVGGQYMLFYILTILFFSLTVLDKKNRILWGSWLAVNLLLWFAIVVLYDVRVGSRHLMPFIIMEGFVLLEKNESRIVVYILISVACYLFLIKLEDPREITYPAYDPVLALQIEEMQEELKGKLNIDKYNRWNNTVLWVLSDTDGSFPWQTLYSLPAGMGINICTCDYVIEMFDFISAKYIACTSGGTVAELCNGSEYKKLLERTDVSICIYEKSET